MNRFPDFRTAPARRRCLYASDREHPSAAMTSFGRTNVVIERSASRRPRRVMSAGGSMLAQLSPSSSSKSRATSNASAASRFKSRERPSRFATTPGSEGAFVRFAKATHAPSIAVRSAESARNHSPCTFRCAKRCFHAASSSCVPLSFRSNRTSPDE